MRTFVGAVAALLLGFVAPQAIAVGEPDGSFGTGGLQLLDLGYQAAVRVGATARQPDGKIVVYERRISGNSKIYAFPLADPSRKTQLTFGPFEDTAPYFSTDGKKIYYSSDEDDGIPNLRGLDLQTGSIVQYTDVFGGTMAPAPIKTPKGDRLAFITYYKGEYKLHTKDTSEPIKEVEQEVRAAAEGLVDFQPCLLYTSDAADD